MKTFPLFLKTNFNLKKIYYKLKENTSIKFEVFLFYFTKGFCLHQTTKFFHIKQRRLATFSPNLISTGIYRLLNSPCCPLLLCNRVGSAICGLHRQANLRAIRLLPLNVGQGFNPELYGLHKDPQSILLAFTRFLCSQTGLRRTTLCGFSLKITCQR